MSNIERRDKINQFFDDPKNQERIKAYFSSEKERESVVNTVRKLALNDDNLKKYDVNSVINAAIDVFEIGLSPVPARGLVYFVAYKKKLGAAISYKGWQHLLDEAGKVVKSFNVYCCDKFKHRVEGFEDHIEFEPNYSEHQDDESQWVEDNIKGVLVMVKDLEKNSTVSKFVNRKKLFQLRSSSPSIRSGKFSPWTNWAAEMFAAKGIKYVVSKLPINEKIAKAVSMDNALDADSPKQLEREVGALELMEGEEE